MMRKSTKYCQDENRIPSFMDYHNYTCTSKSKKRSRDMSTPTGKTPHQISKKDRLTTPLTSSKRKWTLGENEFLQLYVELAGGVPSVGSSEFWQDCAEKLSERCETLRTASVCRKHFIQMKTFSISTDNTKGTQTDFSSSGKERSFSSFVPSVSQDDIPKLNNTESLQKITESLQRCIGKDEEISLHTRNCILTAVSDFNRTSYDIAKVILDQPSIKNSIKGMLLQECTAQASAKCVRLSSSYLYNKGFTDLRDFSFDDLFLELANNQPFLLDHLISVAVSTKNYFQGQDFFRRIVPKLGMIYSVVMSTRFEELSRFQKVISSVLMEEHVHQKVFDRLNVIGITGSYSSANRLVEEIGKHHQDRIVDKIKDGFPIRLIGDNLNVKLGVRHERGDHHGTMYNWFSSAVIVQSNPFTELSQQPQGLAKDLPLDSFLPNSSDISLLCKDYTAHICGIAKEFCPHLDFLFPKSNQFTLGGNRAQLHENNITIPLQTLPLNEQKYSDVVQIMESYESTLKDIYSAAGQSVPSVQVGGDQLTRERFSGGKGLRAGCSIPEEKFAHLTPITFEMWHTGMNFLACIFKELFDESSYDRGTMNSAKIKLSRKTVKADVKNHYDHDKDFYLSFVKSYVVEALCEYFGMQTHNDKPTQNIPPEDFDETWINNTIGDFIEKFVFASSTDASGTCHEDQDITVTIPLNVSLPDGSTVILNITRKEKKRTTYTQHDVLKHYGHTVLQLGLLFMQFVHICTSPDRQRMITTFKFMMKVLKAKNQRSKYALEILRFLCHQQSTYSLQMANMSFYGLFVNNYGRIDGNIAADLQMEHLIRKIKTLFKNCGPNNMDSSVIKKSKAIAGLMQISSNFDNSASVIIRAQKHKNKNAHEDELKVIQELRQEQPFKCKLGRSVRKFESIRAPAEASLDSNHYIAWIKHYQNVFTCEPGQ